MGRLAAESDAGRGLDEDISGPFVVSKPLVTVAGGPTLPLGVGGSSRSSCCAGHQYWFGYRLHRLHMVLTLSMLLCSDIRIVTTRIRVQRVMESSWSRCHEKDENKEQKDNLNYHSARGE
jgi:hypothetical protein